MITMLLFLGADINVENYFGQTSCDLAVSHKITEAINLLCNNGGDVVIGVVTHVAILLMEVVILIELIIHWCALLADFF